MGATKIFEFTTPADPGPPPVERTFSSGFVPLGYNHLSVRCTVTGAWSGSLQIRPITQVFFNRFPQPASPFVQDLPDQSYTTQTSDFLFVTCNNGGPGMQVTVELFGDLVGGGPICAYGTEPKPGTTVLFYLSTAALDLILAEFGLGWMAPFLSAFANAYVDTGGLCGDVPPPMPPIDSSFFSASSLTKKQVLDYILWNHFCQCKPGTPAPTPPGVPVAPQPPGTPAPPSFPCDPADLCSSIADIHRVVAELQRSQLEVLNTVTAMQRYHVPFAYIGGSTHSGLVGEGNFQLATQLGVYVSVTSLPSPPEALRGNPDYIRNLGWLAIVDSTDRLLAEVRLTRMHQIWLPPLFNTADRFTWSLYDGVIIDVQELLAEP